MRTWTYTTMGDDGLTPVTVVKTDAEILVEFYSYWLGMMVRLGKQAEATEEACIQDWAVTHWAIEVK